MSGGWTPAHSAAEAGRITVLRALHNAHISIMKKDKYGERPREVAETYGHVDCVKYLVM
jgi:ankyrin repeat protein